MQTTTIFTLPGWLNSPPKHWQSLWEAQFGDVRVEQHDWDTPLRGDWITRLEDTVQNHLARHLAKQPRTAEPPRIAFAAHSLGCHLVAGWAALSPNVHHVAGALLVAPPDPSMLDLPPQLHSWKQPVLNKLPFKTTLVASTRDPFCSFAAAEKLAADWGSTLVNVGAIGHVNADSGLNDWPAGREMLMALTQI